LLISIDGGATFVPKSLGLPAGEHGSSTGEPILLFVLIKQQPHLV